jgi:hypothetical protein
MDIDEEICPQCSHLNPVPKPSMDQAIIGHWRICSITGPERETKRMVGGLAGEIVEFTSNREYVLWRDPDDPSRSQCQTFDENGVAALDTWIPGLKGITAHCIYRVNASGQLEICFAGNSSTRPSEFRPDDERSWCLMLLERSEPPPKPRKTTRRRLLEPGSFIPKDWVKNSGSSDV